VKSLASGAPMAKVLFPGPAMAIVLVPVMLYHILQLIVCASIAGAMMRLSTGGLDKLDQRSR
jgi:sodium/bile acid cotransporter 7